MKSTIYSEVPSPTEVTAEAALGSLVLEGGQSPLFRRVKERP